VGAEDASRLALRWREDFGVASILRDGGMFGSLMLQQWWTEARGEPEVAWVAGYMDSGTGAWVKVCAESPAQPVTADRVDEMFEKVDRAIAEGPPEIEGPDTASATAPMTVDQLEEQLGLVIQGRALALNDLFGVGADRQPEHANALYVPCLSPRR
jgi:hypothetical protein